MSNSGSLRSTDIWPDRGRFTFYSVFLLIAQVAVWLAVLLSAYRQGRYAPDFATFYAAGSLANAGGAELVYDQGPSVAPAMMTRYFSYPPIFLIICVGLAEFPYAVAFFIFEILTLILCAITARAILQGPNWHWLIAFLAFPPLWWTLTLGQNALLTAALFGGAMLFIDRRPLVSGFVLGALCYKPHLGLLVPVALAAGGHWKAVVAATACVALLIAVSLGMFGLETWQAFFRSAAAIPALYSSGEIWFAGFGNPFGAARMLGASMTAAYALQAAATVLVGCVVGVAWGRQMSIPIRAAILTAGTVVAAPVIFYYDAMLTGIAACWLIRAGVPHWWRWRSVRWRCSCTPFSATRC